MPAKNGNNELSNKKTLNKMTNQTHLSSNDDCEVTISLLFTDSLTAHCSINIKNKSSKNLYFFNLIYTGRTNNGILEVDRNTFYAYIDLKNNLILAKAIVKVPEEFFVEARIYPCCSKIAPYQTSAEDLQLSLPIHLYHPYVTQTPNISEYPVNFQLGYFVGQDQTESMEIKIPSNIGELICFDPFDIEFQKIIEVGMFNPLPVSK
jgi:hypothetical protein